MEHLLTLLLAAVSLLGVCVDADPKDLVRYGFMSDEERNHILDEHNAHRRLEGGANMKKLKWSSALEEIAKEFAGDCTFAHSDDLVEGENLGTSVKGYDVLFRDMIQEWYDEKAFYNYDTGGCQATEQCGHYIQMIWHDTDSVGCQPARCSKIDESTIGDAWLVVCRYWPRRGTGKPFQKGEACSQCGEDYFCEDKLCVSNVTAETTTVATTIAETTMLDTDTTTGEQTESFATTDVNDSTLSATFNSTTSGSSTAVKPTDAVTFEATTIATTSSHGDTDTTTSGSLTTVGGTDATTSEDITGPTEPPIRSCDSVYLEELGTWKEAMELWKAEFADYLASKECDRDQ